MSNMNTNNGLSQIDSVVFYISKLHGIKDIKLEDRKFTVQWLKNNLKGITLEELVNAAQMALDSKLDIHTQVFGNVSPKYLSELMYKYRIWKKEADKQRMLKAPALPAPKTPQEEKDRIIREELYSVYDEFVKTKTLPFCASHILFDYAWKKGMMRYGQIVIDDIKKVALKQLEMDEEVEKGKAKDVFQIRQITDKYQNIDDKTIFKNKCKEIYLNEYFKELYDMDEDIRNFIK